MSVYIQIVPVFSQMIANGWLFMEKKCIGICEDGNKMISE